MAALDSLYGWVQRVCSHRAAPALAIGLSVLACTPALSTGLLADDYVHRLILTVNDELSVYRQSWPRLFVFAEPATHRALQAEGVVAWWADPQLSFSFWRPLSALTHWLDYALWPRSVVLMHVHSLAWNVVALIAAGLVYRALFRPTWIGALALTFYAFDPTRAVTVSWIANRNALIACALSLLSVATFIHGLRGHRPARWTSPALFGAALCAGEGAYGASGYLLGAALFLPHGPRAQRLLSLVPHALLALMILASARALGFGVSASGVYFDPLREPLAYLSALPGRALALTGASLGGPSADAWDAYELILPGLTRAAAAIDLALLGFWLIVLVPLIRRSPSARVAATGIVLAVLPAASAFPSDRLLGLCGVGVMALSAELLAGYLAGSEARTKRLAVAAFLIVSTRLLVAPAALAAQCANMQRVDRVLEQGNQALPDSAELRAQTIVFVNPPQDALVSFIPPLRAARGLPRPVAQRWLATGLSAVGVHRSSERSVEVVQQGGFLRQHTERMVRDPARRPLLAGDRVELPGMRVQILETTADRRPARVRFEFDGPLDSPNLRWLAFREDRYEPFRPPAIGQCVVLPENDLLALLLGQDSPLVRFFAERRAALSPARPNPCSSYPRT